MSANFAFVNQATRTSQTGDSTTSVFPAQNVTTGNFIGVEVAFSNSNSTTATLADTAGNTYFNVGYARSSESGVEYNVGLWIVLSAIGNASNVITVTFSASSSYREGCAEQQSYDGTVELGDVAIGNSTSNTSPWPTSPDVDAVDGDLIFGGFTWFTNSFGGNAGTGYTSRGGDEFSRKSVV